MPRKTLIPLPNLGLFAHFKDTWKTIGGWKGIAVIAAVVLIFNSGVTWYVSRGTARRAAARQKAR
jgi:hypothetical protein